MAATTKQALLVDMDRKGTLCIEDGVYIFDSMSEAVDFAFDTLVKSKQLAIDPDGSVWSVDREERYSDDKATAIEEWQDTLGAMEYFHFRDVREAASEPAVA